MYEVKCIFSIEKSSSLEQREEKKQGQQEFKSANRIFLGTKRSIFQTKILCGFQTFLNFCI